MPHSEQPGYVRAGPWDSVDKKFSRELTIIEMYRKFYGKHLSKDKQYWTMAGAHFDGDGIPILGEYGQLIDSKLITPNQYFGVDRELSIIQKNKGLIPNVNWLHGDFVDVMESYLLKGQFNPAIINYDGVMQPKFGTRYLKRIFKLLDHNFGGEVMLVSNFVLTNPYSRSEKLTFTIHDTIQELSSIYWIPDHWTVLPQGYVYSGVSRNQTRMGILIFIKSQHDIDGIKFSANRKVGNQ